MISILWRKAHFMPRFAYLVLAAMLVVTAVGSAYAQRPGTAAQKPAETTEEKPSEKTAEKSAEKAGEKPKEEKKPPEEKGVQTKHTIRIGGPGIKYTATAGPVLPTPHARQPKAHR